VKMKTSRDLILTSDRQVVGLQDLDKKFEFTLSEEQVFGSLRKIIEDAQKRVNHTATLAFDGWDCKQISIDGRTFLFAD